MAHRPCLQPCSQDNSASCCRPGLQSPHAELKNTVDNISMATVCGQPDWQVPALCPPHHHTDSRTHAQGTSSSLANKHTIPWWSGVRQLALLVSAEHRRHGCLQACCKAAHTKHHNNDTPSTASFPKGRGEQQWLVHTHKMCVCVQHAAHPINTQLYATVVAGPTHAKRTPSPPSLPRKTTNDIPCQHIQTQAVTAPNHQPCQTSLQLPV